MIHSEAGGNLSFNETQDIAKVQILEGENKDKIAWFVVPERLVVKVGDCVLVPFGSGNKLTKAKILRIDEAVSPQSMPISAKHAKQIVSKIKQKI